MIRVRVHGRDHAAAVLCTARAAGRSVTLVSPVALQAGLGWWRALVRWARAEFPDMDFQTVADCGPSAGLALAALRSGCTAVEVIVAPEILEKLADIAGQTGGGIVAGGAPVLDLADTDDPLRACRQWLSPIPAPSSPG